MSQVYVCLPVYVHVRVYVLLYCSAHHEPMNSPILQAVSVYSNTNQLFDQLFIILHSFLVTELRLPTPTHHYKDAQFFGIDASRVVLTLNVLDSHLNRRSSHYDVIIK